MNTYIKFAPNVFLAKCTEKHEKELLNEWIMELKPIHLSIDMLYFHSYSLN